MESGWRNRAQRNKNRKDTNSWRVIPPSCRAASSSVWRWRPLAKGAPLMLLDEPLVNLDYKLREELRDELTQLFAAGDSTVIYATTEPGEALLLDGYTALLDGGERLRYAPTAEVFHTPISLRVAHAFRDPPMNLMAARLSAQGLPLVRGPELAEISGPETFVHVSTAVGELVAQLTGGTIWNSAQR